MFRTKKGYRMATASAAAILASMALTTGAMAQSSTSTIRGSVTDGAAAEAGATITATEVSTGLTAQVRANANGDYVVPGLRPGTYLVEVSTTDGQTYGEVVTLLVGQTADLDLDVATQVADAGSEVDTIIVTGSRPAFEMRTSEVATNVTVQQIEQLPQNSRNFLNFAALAPGVTVSDNENRRDFSSGALNSNNTNVFIDGQNLKNNVLQGGIAGQDASRGNPFPQAAVQEFRVSTQNHKAEYEQAGAAIITAVTRSGTNEFEGEVFGFYQNDNMVSKTEYQTTKPEYMREQYGVRLGGPIIQDKLFYFVSYEANNQDRATTVALPAGIPAPVRAQYDGDYVVPFRSELYFGKLTWAPLPNHTIDLTVSKREETDVRDFGGGTTRDRATDIAIDSTSVNLRWNWSGSNFLNEASIDYLDAFWSPRAASTGRSERTDGGALPVLEVGARTYIQDKGQTGITLRNDLTLTGLGDHLVKMGVKVARLDYEAAEGSFFEPQFIYPNGDYTFASDPIRAEIGFGDPYAKSDNTQIGLYIQDDWDISDRLQINLGLRWDYETNMMNNDFVTPADLAAAVRAYTSNTEIDWENYISNGDRDSFKNAFQPRIGFSYDVNGDGETVVFGGIGRYYDRVLFDYAQVEHNRSNYRVYTVTFDPVTNPWSDTYYDREELLDLVVTGGGLPEAYMVADDVKMPYSDQLSLGIRKQFGDWNTALTYSHVRSYDGFSWVLANRFADGSFRNPAGDMPWCCYGDPANHPAGFASIIVSESADESYYDALFLQIDKPYTRESNWGMTLAYTLADAEEYGNRGPYALDAPDAESWGRHRAEAAERHRVVFSGMVGLPFDVMASTLVTLGSGQAYQRAMATGGNPFFPGAGEPEKFDFIIPDAWAFRQVDVRLSKDFQLPNGHEFGVILDAINVFDFANYGYDEWSGQKNRVIGPPRSFQVGLRYRW